MKPIDDASHCAVERGGTAQSHGDPRSERSASRYVQCLIYGRIVNFWFPRLGMREGTLSLKGDNWVLFRRFLMRRVRRDAISLCLILRGSSLVPSIEKPFESLPDLLQLDHYLSRLMILLRTLRSDGVSDDPPHHDHHLHL